ncbi:MAG: uroporphyrinogen decarboxylase family protein [Elusimicrobia bacterium]|nr:uroporphyrinogen decarboxylase family protein [Elusimicrobiota bacterium]
MKQILEKYLSKFEKTVDLEHQKKAKEICGKIFKFEKVEELPYISNDIPKVYDKDWPVYPYNDIFVDESKMLLDQLRLPFLHNQLKDYHPLNIRCHYGTVILPSILGAKYQLTENSLPWSHHLESRDEIQKLIDKGIPDLKNGLGKKCFETLDFYKETLSNYPKLNEAIDIYHPDLQGPFDVAHLLWGHDIFLALYDCPEVVHSLLELITKTYSVWMKEWLRLTGKEDIIKTHWQFYVKGNILIRDDSAVMLSEGHYNEFVKPYNQKLLDEFGGCIHFCGKGDIFIKSMCETKNLFAIQPSQLHLNDMDLLVKSAISNKIVILGLNKKYLEKYNFKTGVIVLNW